MISARSRVFVYQVAIEDEAQVIAIRYQMPFNATLLQFSAAFDRDPANADTFTVRKESGVDPLLNVLIRTFSPGVTAQTDIICNEYFEFKKGDFLVIDYNNAANISVGVEAIIREGA